MLLILKNPKLLNFLLQLSAFLCFKKSLPSPGCVFLIYVSTIMLQILSSHKNCLHFSSFAVCTGNLPFPVNCLSPQPFNLHAPSGHSCVVLDSAAGGGSARSREPLSLLWTAAQNLVPRLTHPSLCGGQHCQGGAPGAGTARQRPGPAGLGCSLGTCISGRLPAGL